MSIDALYQLIHAPAPGFRCSAIPRNPGRQFVAEISHVLNPPATPDTLKAISEILGPHGSELIDFYRIHEGLTLYIDKRSDRAGVALFPFSDWDEETEQYKKWWEDLLDEDDSDPDCVLTGIPIGEAPHSGNYLVMPIEGPHPGKIFYVNHDGWYEEAFATSFNDFLLQSRRAAYVEAWGIYAFLRRRNRYPVVARGIHRRCAEIPVRIEGPAQTQSPCGRRSGTEVQFRASIPPGGVTRPTGAALLVGS